MTSAQIVKLLNESLEIDRKALSILVEHRCCVLDPGRLESHPTLVPAVDSDGDLSLGLLGILNGIVGLDGDLIEAVYGDEPLIITSFRLRERKTDAYADAAI